MTTAASSFDPTPEEEALPVADPLIEHRIRVLEAECVKSRATAETVIRMGETMVAFKDDLVRGRKRMDEIDEAIDAESDRISALENSLPLLREYGEWVKRAALGIFGILGTVVAAVIVAALTRL